MKISFQNKMALQLLLIFVVTIVINAQTESSIKILTPNGNEYWTTGSFPRITWESTNITVVKIEVSYDGGINWEEISPAAVSIYGYFSSWQLGDRISNECLIKISKYDEPNVFDISDSYFKIVEDQTINNIVVLGSSTAAGVGASKIDSAWVTKYKNYMYERNTTVKVINLAIGGYTTYDIMPTGFVPPLDRPTPKVGNNITKAVEYNPKAIIINLPSNDVNMGYSITEQLTNYDSITTIAYREYIPVWISTTQPRNFSTAQIQQQIVMRDSTYSRFGENAIDFWTDIADSNGRIDPQFNSGDGIHLNDKGHAILFSRVINKNIFDPIFTSVENNTNEVFAGYFLAQNYPNPFNPSTTIEYELPVHTIVSVKIYDILGREIATLIDEPKEAGHHTLNFDASQLVSGAYFFRIKTDNFVQTKKMIFLK